MVAFLGTAHERTTLDLKRDYDRTSPLRPRYELAKDTAAFANALGGTLLVGAIEGTGASAGRATAFLSVPDPQALINELTEASRLCYPPPVIEPHRARVDASQQSLLLNRRCCDDADLLIINVQASLGGPIGCLDGDANGNRVDHAYRFPLRTSEGTRYLRPDELPFHMNSHERRTLLHLRQIDLDTPIDVWGRDVRAPMKPCTCSLVRVDGDRLVAVVDLRNGWPMIRTFQN